MIEFLTSKTGVFAAIVAVIALCGALWKLYTDLADRFAKKVEKEGAVKRSKQGLAIVHQQLSELSLSSNHYDLQFIVTNTGSSKLIMSALLLNVTARCESVGTRDCFTLAPLTVHQHRVELGPIENVYDIRKRHFGRGSEPLAFDPGEAEAFVVKLVSSEIIRYNLHVEATWFGATDPKKTGSVRSDSFYADFPNRISVGPPTGTET